MMNETGPNMSLWAIVSIVVALGAIGAALGLGWIG